MAVIARIAADFEELKPGSINGCAGIFDVPHSKTFHRNMENGPLCLFQS